MRKGGPINDFYLAMYFRINIFGEMASFFVSNGFMCVGGFFLVKIRGVAEGGGKGKGESPTHH